MKSLIDDLENMASTPGGSVCDLLRKAKIVAVKLKQTETSSWIDSELSGQFQEYPSYRKVPVKLMYRNPYHGMQPLMFDSAGMNETVNQPRVLPNPIKEIEEIARGQDAVFIGLTPSIIESLANLGAPTLELFHMTPRTAVAAIADAVRTRVLDWALALDEKGVRGENMQFTDYERQSAQNITIHFNGATNFAGVIGQSEGVGASDVDQNHSVYRQAGDVATKIRESADNLDHEDSVLVEGVAAALQDAAEKREPERLKKALLWAKAAFSKISGFAAKAALEHELDAVLDGIPI
jgi:hypothetical protein